MNLKLLTSTANSPRLFGRILKDEGAEGGATGNAGEAAGAAGAGAAASGEGQGNAGGQDDATVLGGAGEGQAGEKKGVEEGKGEGEGGADAGASVVPEKYELTPPDGFENIDTEVLEAATPTFKELGLSNDQAQKLVPFAADLVKKTMDKAEAAITDRAIQNRKDWAEAFDKDAEIGGANKEQTIKDAAKAFDHYGLKKGEGLRLLLDESGLGNHPDLIRFVAKVGRDLAEGTHDRGAAATTPKTPEGALYGPEFQAKG